MKDGINYLITYYSKVSWPNNTSGLFNTQLEFKPAGNREGDVLPLRLDVFYILEEMEGMGNRRFEVLKTQSRFEIKRKTQLTDKDCYEIIIKSITELKKFLQKESKNIENHLLTIPNPPQQAMQHEITQILNLYYQQGLMS